MKTCPAIALAIIFVVGSTASAQKPAPLAELKGVASVAYAPDSSFLLVDYRADGKRPEQSNSSLGIWDAKTGEFRIAMEKPTKGCDRIAVSPDGKKAAAIDIGGKEVKVWNTETGKLIESQALPAWNGSIRGAPFLKFSADSKSLYSIRDKQILEYTIGEKPKLSETVDWFGPNLIAFDPEAKRLIVVRNIMGKPAADIRAFDLEKGSKPVNYRTNDHIESIALSQDGKTLAISYLKGTKTKTRFELWDVPAFKHRSTLPADARKAFHQYGAMTFSPDGKMIAACPVLEPRGDTIADLFDLEGKMGAGATGKSFATALAFSPDGKTLAATLFDNILVLIDPTTGKPK